MRDASGCEGFIDLELATQGGLPSAQISAPVAPARLCLDDWEAVSAMLPENATGAWSASSSAVQIADASMATTEIRITAPGIHWLYWTLSAPGCPDYSTDSIQITVRPAPVALDDGPIEAASPEVLAMILDNDLIGGGIPSVEIVQQGRHGLAVWDGTALIYTPAANSSFNGLDTVTYALCLDDCPVCDTALVIFSIRNEQSPCSLDDLPDSIFPEGITPNGDGYNDYLEFIIVDPAVCPFQYRRSELIVYNRWGDRVFEQSPYENRWTGTGPNGQELPPGVYYYVLRIKLQGDPFVWFGTVTIFR